MNWSNKWPDPEAELGKHIVEPKAPWPTATAVVGIDLASTPDKTTLIFLDGNKRRSIDVIIVGDLALDYDDNGWNIYHVPTLTCFSKAVPPSSIELNFKDEGTAYYSYSRDGLLAWMKKVQENYPTSWQMLRLLTPDNHADKGRRAKEIILEWCLSTPVIE